MFIFIRTYSTNTYCEPLFKLSPIRRHFSGVFTCGEANRSMEALRLWGTILNYIRTLATIDLKTYQDG